MLANTPMHPFRAYVHNLCLVSNEKLADPVTGQFRRLSLHRRLLICNVITDTSATLCQPAYLSMRHYSHDIRYIPNLAPAAAPPSVPPKHHQHQLAILARHQKQKQQRSSTPQPTTVVAATPPHRDPSPPAAANPPPSALPIYAPYLNGSNQPTAAPPARCGLPTAEIMV